MYSSPASSQVKAPASLHNNERLVGVVMVSHDTTAGKHSTKPRLKPLEIVTVRGPRHAHPLQNVGVEGLHDQEIQRHHALATRLGPRPVRVLLAAQHVQVRPHDLTAQCGSSQLGV